ncbi:MAG: hypothetical protein NTX06_09235 [Proteobacteria bacterium]|nr:hypothetical protein [Pseudomonadota bacterium]
MKSTYTLLIACALAAVLLHSPAAAHVPYIERQDFSFDHPFIMKGSVENSIAVYAWLESGNDTDVFRLQITGPARLYCNVIVPVCPAYAQFLPRMALAGPGLAPPDEPLPFVLPEGYGAVVLKNTAPGEQRQQFYEPFGGKSYYNAPAFDQTVSQTGIWYLYVWDPSGMGGDYVAVVGYKERFSLTDFFRALINTFKIRFNRELHTDCRNSKS